MQTLNFKTCSNYYRPLFQMQRFDPVTTLRSRIHTPSNNDSTNRKLNAVHDQECMDMISIVAEILCNHSKRIEDMLPDAVHHRDVNHLQNLLNMGVNPNLRSGFGTTPLLEACAFPILRCNMRTEMIEYLLKFGADPLMECYIGRLAITPLELLCIMSRRIPAFEYDLNAILDLFYKHTGCAEEAEALMTQKAISLNYKEMIEKLRNFNQSRNNE